MLDHMLAEHAVERFVRKRKVPCRVAISCPGMSRILVGVEPAGQENILAAEMQLANRVVPTIHPEHSCVSNRVDKKSPTAEGTIVTCAENREQHRVAAQMALNVHYRDGSHFPNSNCVPSFGSNY